MSLPGRGTGCRGVGKGALLALAMLAGCARLPGPPQPGAVFGGSQEATLPPLAGSVDRRFLYRIQATIKEDVAPAASVSFIEPGTLPRTVATTVTTDDGRFVLDLGGRFDAATGKILAGGRTDAAGAFSLAPDSSLVPPPDGFCYLEVSRPSGAAITSGNYVLDDVDTGVSVARNFISQLSTDARLRRHGVPGATSGSGTAFFGSDYLWKETSQNAKPIRGCNWGSGGGRCGVWALDLGYARSLVSAHVGFRPVLKF